jgi:hypothetical protein
LTAVACQSQSPVKEVTLPSGQKVKVVSITRVYYSNDSPALMLRYQTDLKVSDVSNLRKEADQIFQFFKNDVEVAHLTNAVMSATEAPEGGIFKTAKGFNFVYRKSADGVWRLQADAAPPQGASPPK